MNDREDVGRSLRIGDRVVISQDHSNVLAHGATGRIVDQFYTRIWRVEPRQIGWWIVLDTAIHHSRDLIALFHDVAPEIQSTQLTQPTAMNEAPSPLIPSLPPLIPIRAGQALPELVPVRIPPLVPINRVPELVSVARPTETVLPELVPVNRQPESDPAAAPVDPRTCELKVGDTVWVASRGPMNLLSMQMRCILREQRLGVVCSISQSGLNIGVRDLESTTTWQWHRDCLELVESAAVPEPVEVTLPQPEPEPTVDRMTCQLKVGDIVRVVSRGSLPNNLLNTEKQTIIREQRLGIVESVPNTSTQTQAIHVIDSQSRLIWFWRRDCLELVESAAVPGQASSQAVEATQAESEVPMAESSTRTLAVGDMAGVLVDTPYALVTGSVGIIYAGSIVRVTQAASIEGSYRVSPQVRTESGTDLHIISSNLEFVCSNEAMTCDINVGDRVRVIWKGGISESRFGWARGMESSFGNEYQVDQDDRVGHLGDRGYVVNSWTWTRDCLALVERAQDRSEGATSSSQEVPSTTPASTPSEASTASATQPAPAAAVATSNRRYALLAGVCGTDRMMLVKTSPNRLVAHQQRLGGMVEALQPLCRGVEGSEVWLSNLVQSDRDYMSLVGDCRVATPRPLSYAIGLSQDPDPEDDDIVFSEPRVWLVEVLIEDVDNPKLDLSQYVDGVEYTA